MAVEGRLFDHLPPPPKRRRRFAAGLCKVETCLGGEWCPEHNPREVIMQTESDLTSKFLKLCRERPWIADKTNDRIAHGRPDATIYGHGRAVFIEFKRDPRPGPVDSYKLLTPKQARELRRRYVVSGGRAFVFAFRPAPGTYDKPIIDVYLGNGRRVLSGLAFMEAVGVVSSALSTDSWFQGLTT